MIPSRIRYLRPLNAEEAVSAWRVNPGSRYLSGGTEISTTSRRSASYPVSTLIDIKHIAEARALQIDGDMLLLGSALPLSAVADSGHFPLLTATIKGIADRTTRNRLSLGGNIAGMLPYRESVLPLLLADAHCTSMLQTAGLETPQLRAWRLRDRFNKRLLLEPGELILSFSVPLSFTTLPWSHGRKTRTGPIDYPLVTLCLVKNSRNFLLGLSGAHPYPLRSDETDDLLSRTEPVDVAIQALGPAKTDHRASDAYRTALLKTMLETAIKELS